MEPGLSTNNSIAHATPIMFAAILHS
jgi:hypothetical protein